jgi:hypothetical protein
MSNSTLKITQESADKFTLHNLNRNEGIWIQVENFDIRINRTDEGIIVDLYAHGEDNCDESIAGTSAHDNDTLPEED